MKKLMMVALLASLMFACSKKEDNKEKKEVKKDQKVEKKVENKDTKKDSVVKKDDAKDVKKTVAVDASSDRKKIVSFAKQFDEKKIPVSSKWNKYASGFIKMVYLKYGVNLTDVENKKDDEGKWLSTTKLIHAYVKEHGDLFKDRNPKPGDIVFLDNTFDINKDGEFNDTLSSIGLVTEVDNEGTIYFLYNTSKGVKLKVMNLKTPEQESIKDKNVTKTVNSRMRWLTKKEKAMEGSDTFPILSSQMLNSFGSILDKHALSDLAYKVTLTEADRASLVKLAKSFEGNDMPDSKRYTKSTSGFVKMLFLKHRLNPTDVENKKDEEGKWLSTSQMMYDYVKTHGELFKDRNPKAGDIVFLDNTYDKNKDEAFNDLVTSVGFVVDVDSEGTIYFLYRTSKGVSLKVMNLKNPEQENIKNKNITKTINTKMRWLTKKQKAMEGSDNFPTLSSQLLNSFGSLYK